MVLNIRPTIRPTFRPIPISSRPGPRHKALEAVCFLVILLSIIQEAISQSVTTSDQTAKEGDAEVLITCDYSQFISTTPEVIEWNELEEDGFIKKLVDDKKIENGRFKLITSPGKADLVMSEPMRIDSQRTFQCEIQTTDGYIQRTNYILTVYYLDQPLLNASASTVYEGQSVTFTCSKPDGDPIPDITWYKDGQTVNTNNTSRYEMVNYSTESVLKIKSATDEDAGRYTCKAESDQFKGDDAKTSVGKQLNIIYIAVTFTSEDGGVATCTAEGHPKPSSVLILQDGEVIEEVVKKGENTATIEITDEVCQSSLTCYAENGKLNDTTPLEKCNAGAGSFIVLIVVVVVGLFLWLLLLVYFMYYKNIEWSNKDIYTVTVEGGNPVEMSFKYRPSIARFKTFEIKKEDKVIGSNQQEFSSWKTVCQFVCYCCAYFCGFFCIEYCDKSFEYNSKDKRKHLSSSDNKSGEESHMNGSEREEPDGADVPLVVIKSSSPNQSAETEDTAALPKSGETSKTNPVNEGSELLAEHQETSDSSKRSKIPYSMLVSNGRGRISLKCSNPVRCDSGKYNCSIEGSRQQCSPGVNTLSVYWIVMENPKYSTEKSVSNFEMKCSYGPADMPLTGYKWKKIREDGTTEIEDCDKDSRFEVISYKNGTLSLMVKNVELDDAGKYQCEVKPVDGEKELTDTTQLTVKEDAIKIDIPDVFTNESVNVKLFLNLTYVDDSAAISNVKWYKHFEDEAKELLTSLQPPYSTPGCQSAYEDKSKVYLKINNVESENAGNYACEVQVEGRQKIYSCFGRLEVQGPVLTMENKELHAVEGGNARIPFYVSPIQKQINKFIFYKFEKEIADSLTIFRRFKIKYSEDKLTGFLEISNVKSSDAGDYRCKCVIEGKDVYSTTSRLEVTKGYIKLNDCLVMNGEKAVLTCKYGLENQVKYVIWYKKTEDESQQKKIEKVPERCKVTHDRLNQTSLEFPEVTLADDGEYICELTTATEITKGKLSETHTSSAHLHVQYIKLNDCLATHGDKAVLTCKYGIENQVTAFNWYKKTADQDIMIFTSDKYQEKKIKTAPEGCKAIFKENESSLVFEQVSLADAGEYMCKVKEKLPSHTASAHLHVQCDVFTEQVKTHRHPTVVFINSLFIVLCEQNNSDVIMRRGKLNGKSLIEWKKTKILLNEKETSFQNVVPIVTDKKNGKLILMCVRQNNNTKERKIIRMKSDDNGVNWTEPEDVQLDLKGLPIDFISLGHGVCLNSGKLVVAGIWTLKDNESIEKKLFVMTGTNDGDTWDIVTAVKPPYATLGGHTLVVEYANDDVYISCSLEDCKQRFHVYGDEGFKAFDVKTEDELEANPECQGGIVRLPTKTNKFYQIAVTSHGNETNKDLTLHLSEDGCETWCQFNTLGAVNAEESDLAYYSVKEGKEQAKGIVCVYSYGSDTEGYKIGLQLISNKEIIQK